jgi:hypothetical protein
LTRLNLPSKPAVEIMSSERSKWRALSASSVRSVVAKRPVRPPTNRYTTARFTYPSGGHRQVRHQGAGRGEDEGDGAGKHAARVPAEVATKTTGTT